MNRAEFDKLTFQDMQKMDVKQLKNIVSAQGQVANKRYDRIASNSKTFKGAVNEAGGRFSVAGLNDIESLAGEAKRIQAFNRSEFGTYQGAIQMTKDINNVVHGGSGSVKTVKGKRKKKKKQKTLKQIKKDIQKKYKKVLKEKGKKEAEKYRNRAMSQYKRIQKKRAEERQKRREEKEEEKKQNYDNEPEEPEEPEEKEPEEPEEAPEPPEPQGKYVKGVGYIDNFEEEQENFYKEKEQQEFMSTINDEDWSGVFI